MSDRIRPEGMTASEWRNLKKKDPAKVAAIRAGDPLAFTNHEHTEKLDIPHLPSPLMSAAELRQRRTEDFDRVSQAEGARKLIHVKVPIDGPIALLHFGDPHIDDNGTDIRALYAHAEMVRDTPGLFGCNLGDTTNNWVGKLAHLYGEQSTSAAEAWILAEDWIKTVGSKWLYLIAGNHDVWSGPGDPLRWIIRQMGVTYEDHGIRVSLDFPNGVSVVVSARHNWPGSSQYNPAHAQGKEAMFGIRDDIIISGHTHKSGWTIIKDPESGRICHGIQVATYKKFDRYAKREAFKDQAVSPCAVTVIDPYASDPAELVVPFWSPIAGVCYLKAIQARESVA